MFTALSPSDFVVAESFRWRGLVYKKGSGLPPAIPQGAIHQFLHRNPPLIELKNNNGSRRKASNKKTTKKKTTKKKTKRG